MNPTNKNERCEEDKEKYGCECTTKLDGFGNEVIETHGHFCQLHGWGGTASKTHGHKQEKDVQTGYADKRLIQTGTKIDIGTPQNYTGSMVEPKKEEKPMCIVCDGKLQECPSAQCKGNGEHKVDQPLMCHHHKGHQPVPTKPALPDSEKKNAAWDEASFIYHTAKHKPSSDGIEFIMECLIKVRAEMLAEFKARMDRDSGHYCNKDGYVSSSDMRRAAQEAFDDLTKKV